MEAAAAGSNSQMQIILREQARNFFGWIFISGYLISQALPHRQKALRFDRGDGPFYDMWVASIFAFGALFALLAQGSARTAEKVALTKVLFMCELLSMSTYLIQAYRISVSLPSWNGWPVDVARFLEWITTCPILIQLISDVCKTPDLTHKTVTFDYILLVCGFMASITRNPYSFLFSWIAFGCFTQVVTGLWSMFQRAIDGNTACKLHPSALRQAQLATCVSWACFPTVWLLMQFKVVSYGTGELLYGIADIFAKVVLTLILVNATVEQAQSERVSALESIATDMEKELGNTGALLSRMMPPEVIEQLKSGRAPGAEEYDSVTVFFSDITNFTVLSSQTSTKDMLATLNKLWLEYDAIAKKWGVYKVETIGDAYLGVVGCPTRSPDHAANACSFALDIVEMVRGFKTEMGSSIQIRVGLNSGPITAGVLGDLNPHWCIVGDTVNTASRMESTSKPMHVHCSESTYKLANPSGRFRFAGPDVLQIKGKGTMATYWVERA
ncbi:nucleotide cyclase [Gorgonomyces haynaldii]|nr:nucleotide cyclase [Gorgonomyces haynaldii]